MTWLYRLQQHTALTHTERNALAVLVLTFTIGVGVRHVREQQAPSLDAGVFALETARFTSASATPTAALIPRVDSVRASATEAIRAEAATLPDSLRGVVERAASRRGGAKKAAFTGRMNLNTATQAQLELLPRVGPKMAEKIIAYRSARGGFRRVAELDHVKGVGDKTLALLTPHLFVE